jgi:hypothetical protein
MDVRADSAIQAFRRHATISIAQFSILIIIIFFVDVHRLYSPAFSNSESTDEALNAPDIQ